MITAILYLLFFVSCFCIIVGSIGLIRLPDVYNRLHASTVVVVGGVVTSVLAAGLYGGGGFFIKAVIIAGFIFITSPVGSHVIARAAHLTGVSLHQDSCIDKLQEKQTIRRGQQGND